MTGKTSREVGPFTYAVAAALTFAVGFAAVVDPLVAIIEKSGAKAVIPPRSNRKTPRDYDHEIYRERNKIERLFARLKQCRRIATRYEKTARNFLAFLHLASAMIWLA